jgi:hypothetical protein
MLKKKRYDQDKMRLDLKLFLGLVFLVACGMILLHLSFESCRTPSSPFLTKTSFTTTTNSKAPKRSSTNLPRNDDTSQEDLCWTEYQRVTQDRTQGLTVENLRRSRAWIGNEHRLQKVASSMATKPMTVLVAGGSISLGHGIFPNNMRYSDQLQVWLNENYPLDGNDHHTVLNKGSHGADMCAMAKRLSLLLQDVPNVDLIILEFAVNDYQGQDHKIHLDHKTDVFFDGFEQLSLCAEVVVHKLLQDTKAAILFLEFQTAIMNRKTAQLLHMGVAQHYQIPVISYAETMFPDYYRLVQQLEPYGYSVAAGGENILPYPHGCAPCQEQSIIEQFRPAGCKSLCIFMKRSGAHADCDTVDAGRVPCHVPFLAHDAVHPSVVGHGIAKDLIVEALTSTQLTTCRRRLQDKSTEFSPPHVLPPNGGGWLASPSQLSTLAEFVLVQDTMEIFSKQDPLLASYHTEGFELASSNMADRMGWIAKNPEGGEVVEFAIDLPKGCYVAYVAALKSYENMGTFTISVMDESTKKTTALEVDGIWLPRISIPLDIQVTSDENPGCSGKCRVTISTDPQVSGRGGNQVKIMTLSARKCVGGHNTH